MYCWLPIIFGCHCRADRSFFFRGRQFPICARCTGELLGIITAFLSWPFWHPGMGACALLLVPLILDGFLQLLTPYTSTNLRRLWTGFLFGYGFAGLFLLTSGIAWELGRSFGKTWK